MGKIALAKGKQLAIAKAKEYAPIIAEREMAKLNQMGSGRRRGRKRRRNQKGKGFLGNLLKNVGQTVLEKAANALPI